MISRINDKFIRKNKNSLSFTVPIAPLFMKHELTHDSIARQINAKASNDARLRKKIKAYLNNKLELYQIRNFLLTSDDLDYIRQGEDLIAWNQEEQEFINNSKAKIARDKRRNFLIWLSIGILLLAAAIASTVFGIQANQEKEKAKLSRDSTKTALKIVEQREKDLKNALDSLELKETELQQAVIDISKEKDAKEAEQKRTVHALNKAEREASIASAQRLAFLANRENDNNNIVDAQILANAAWQAAKYPKPSTTYKAFIDLWNGEQTDLLYYSPINTQRGTISQIKLTPNGDRILCAHVLSRAYERDRPFVSLYDQDGTTLKTFETNSETIDDMAMDNMAIDFSADGQYFSTIGKDGLIYIYDRNGNLLQDFKPDYNKTFGASFLDQSDLILSYSSNYDASSINIQNLEKEKIGTIQNHSEEFDIVGVFPEVDRLFTATQDTIFMWNNRGHLIHKIQHDLYFPEMQLTKEKNYFLLKEHSKALGIYDLNGQTVWSCEEELKDWEVFLSHMPQQIIGYNQDTLKFWDFQGNQLNYRLLPGQIKLGFFPRQINSAVVFIENEFYQIPNLEQYSKINKADNFFPSEWKIQTQRKNYDRTFYSNHSENYFVTTNYDNDILLWSIAENKAIKEINIGKAVTDYYCSKAKNIVVLELDDEFLPLKLVAPPLTSFKVVNGIEQLKISEDGQSIIFEPKDVNYSADGILKTTEISRKAKVFHLNEKRVLDREKDSPQLFPQNEWFSVFDPNFKQYVFSDLSKPPKYDKKAIQQYSSNKEFFWDGFTIFADQGNKTIYTSHQYGLSLAFSPSSQYFVQRNGDYGEEIIVGTTKGKMINKFKTIRGRKIDLEISGQYKKVVTVTDSIVMIQHFNGETAFQINDIGNISCVFLSQNERYLAVGSKKSIAQIWDLKTNRLVQSFEAEDIIYDIKISDDNRYLLVGSGKKVMLWDTFGHLIANLDRHTGFIEKVDFFPDQKRFLSYCDENEVIIWPMPNTIDEWLEKNPIALPTEEQKRKYGLK